MLRINSTKHLSKTQKTYHILSSSKKNISMGLGRINHNELNQWFGFHNMLIHIVLTKDFNQQPIVKTTYTTE